MPFGKQIFFHIGCKGAVQSPGSVLAAIDELWRRYSRGRALSRLGSSTPAFLEAGAGTAGESFSGLHSR